MCGRFSLRLNRDEIQQLPGHNIDIEEWEDEEEFVPRYNIAPRTQAPVIRRRGAPGPSGSAPGSTSVQAKNPNALIMKTMKWGLVPHWSKFEDKTLNTTNARSENLVEGGGMWASIKGKNRCAIPCQGYYEWLNRGKSKLPHFTKRKDGKLLLMAGLYDSVVLEGRTLWTFTIVTTDANKEFSWLHDRQPVFLSDGDALDRWLDTSSQMWTPEFSKMVRPYSDTNVPLECYAVPTEVGKVGTESPSFIEPITSRKDGIQAMFSKQRQNSPTKSQPTVASPTKRRRESSISPLPEKVDHRSSASSQATTAGGSFQSKRLRSGDKDIDKSNKPDNAKTRTTLAKELTKEDSKTTAKTPVSPSKRSRKTAKAKAAGNPKISSFFGKT